MLTEQQAGTIQHIDETKLIIALPGSGKTYTFVSLAENILQASNNYSVLLVTFTNASAAEMTERLKKRVGDQLTKRTKSSTFASLMMHQFKRISRGRKAVIGAEQQLFIRRALIAENVHYDDLHQWQSTIDEIGRIYPTPVSGDKTVKVFLRYEQILSESHRYDLNGMARELIDGLNSGKVKPYPHTHILCDEFQDTDNLQYLWLKAHGDAGCTLAAVGDDDQAIYGWRGSLGYQAFVDFQNDFEASAYLLSLCFRCAPSILSSASAFIENNEDRVPKNMSSAVSEKGSVNIVEIPKTFVSSYLEDKEKSDEISISSRGHGKNLSDADMKKLERYRFVAQKIKNLNEVNWAILARTNKQLDLMERAFAELQISSLRIGGKSIFDNIHAVSMINLFYGLVFDKSAKELVSGLSWTGEKEPVLNHIQRHIQRLGFSAVTPDPEHPWEPITTYLQEQATLSRNCSTHEHAKRFVKKWQQIMKRIIHHLNDKDQSLQLTLLDIFVTMLQSMDGTLQTLANQLKEKTQRTRASKSTDDSRVVLSTMNGAKGLEWDQVWLIDFEKGMVPMLKDDTSDEAIEEERRLVYVAMTRARLRLVISYREKSPSPFIEEIQGVFGGI